MALPLLRAAIRSQRDATSGWFGPRKVIPARCDKGDWSGAALLHAIISEEKKKKSLASTTCVYGEAGNLKHVVISHSTNVLSSNHP